MWVAACGPRPLVHSCASAEELSSQLLDALRRGDERRLRSLAVSEEEFRDHIWPGLPAARPERNVPFAYVWGDLRQKSEASLRAVINAHRSKRYQLVGVSFAGGVSAFAGYRIYRQALLRVRNSAGQLEEVRVCGSFLEKNGGWKVFSYVVEE